MSMTNKSEFDNALKIYTTFINLNITEKKEGKHDFSLINCLLKINNEVQLHSRFIYAMINPEGSHYCGNVFLQTFLNCAGLKDFISTDDAVVCREKGNIDLLIHDNYNFIIIENKLGAQDQKHQISRYIEYVTRKYFLDNKLDLSNRIKIIYLSKSKSIPDDASDSIKGFKWGAKYKESYVEMIWGNEPVELNNKKQLNLADDTKFYFKRIDYDNDISSWVKSSINWLEETNQCRHEGICNSKEHTLIYAFNEYNLVLNRLNKDNYRKNIMVLDEYVMHLNENDREPMYKFMLESYKRLHHYQGKLLHSRIMEVFSNERYEILSEGGLPNNYMSESNCIDWVRKKGNIDKWKNVGFQFKIKEYPSTYLFFMAEARIYIGKVNKKGKFSCKNNVIDLYREKFLTKDSGVNKLISMIDERLKSL